MNHIITGASLGLCLSMAPGTKGTLMRPLLVAAPTPSGDGAIPYGTLQMSDTLNPLLLSQASVLDFGEGQAYEAIAADLIAWNALIQEELAFLAEMTDDVTRVYGGTQAGQMLEGDEFSDPDSQKVSQGYAISFPLRRGEYKVAFTRDYLATNSAAQLAAQYDAAKLGDLQRMQRKFQEAIFYPVSRPITLPNGSPNPNAYTERLVKPLISLPLFPFLNADGAPVPSGPNGETFDPATHTHYMASNWGAGGSTAITRDGDLQAACNNLIEHKITGRLVIFINYAQAATVRAMPSFVPLVEMDTRPGSDLTVSTLPALDPRNFNNRRIGTFLGFEVWIKPWIFPGFLVPMALGDSSGRPLVWRHRKNRLWADFTLFYKDDDAKLRADLMIRDGGCSVWQRHMGVVLYTLQATYTSPVPAGP